MEQEFNLADILTIATGRLLTPIGNVYKILNFMTSDDLYTHQLGRAMRICKPEILIQYPQFDAPEFSVTEVGKLVLMIESAQPDERKFLIAGWMLKQIEIYGDRFLVTPLGVSDWNKLNPIDELENMVGKEKIVVVGD